MCILNSVGDNTEPCGTPNGQGIIEDSVSPTLTCWLLCSRKLFGGEVILKINVII
jgi:hypothetical protein